MTITHPPISSNHEPRNSGPHTMNPGALKLAWSIAAALTTGAIWAATMTWQTIHPIILGQDAVDISSIGTSVIPATALTVTSGALAYIVRLIAQGSLVHRDPSVANAKLSEQLKTSTEAIQASTEALRKVSAREEEIYRTLLAIRDRDRP